jgi:hypothetical protein
MMEKVRAHDVLCAPTFGVPRPVHRRRYLKKVRVVSSKPLTLIIVSPELVTTVTHFVNQRTVWCTNKPDNCPYPHDRNGACRWCAWLAAQYELEGEVVLLRLTEFAVESCPELEDTARSLRGRELHVKRIGGNVRCKMHAYLTPEPPLENGLARCPDLQEYLKEMLEADNRETPRRYTLEHDAMDAGEADRSGKTLFLH